MKVIIDRFENDQAIVEIEKGDFVSIPKILVPTAKEGDVISIEIDISETEKRKKNIKNLMDDLFS